MTLKPQDIVVALKLLTSGSNKISMQKLGVLLGLSSSRIHESIHRLERANLITNHAKVGRYLPIKANLIEFIVHGIKYAFIPEIGEYTRGIPTASFAPPLNEVITDQSEPPYIWPDANGEIKGISFTPLHRCVPEAIRQDKKLYELLAMVDSIRGGGARERKLAIDRVGQWLASE